MELLYKRGEEERKKHLAAVRVLLYIFLPLLFLFFLCISVYSAALMEERQGILYYSCNDQCMYKVCCILCIKESSERKRRRADDDVVLKTTIKKKTKNKMRSEPQGEADIVRIITSPRSLFCVFVCVYVYRCYPLLYVLCFCIACVCVFWTRSVSTHIHTHTHTGH